MDCLYWDIGVSLAPPSYFGLALIMLQHVTSVFFTLEYPYACSYKFFYKFFSLFIHFGVNHGTHHMLWFLLKGNYSCSSSCYGSTRPMSSLAHLKVMSHDSAWLVAGFPWMLLLCIDLCVLDARLPG